MTESAVRRRTARGYPSTRSSTRSRVHTENLQAAKKEFEKTEDDLKPLQSIGADYKESSYTSRLYVINLKCGHCKKLAPEYEKLGANFKKAKSVLIGKFKPIGLWIWISPISQHNKEEDTVQHIDC